MVKGFDPNNFLYPDFDVVMRDNQTDETKIVHLDLAWYEHSPFMWEEGNFSCDCTRSLFFYNHEESKEYPCGHDKISVIKIIFPDGKEHNPYEVA